MWSKGFQKLVREAKRGDKQAVDRLLITIRPRLKEIAEGYADPNCAEQSCSDLVQVASLQVWKKLDDFRGADGDEQEWKTFNAWIGQIVRNLALNLRRDRERLRRKPEQGLISLAHGGAEGSSDGPRSPEPVGREFSPAASAQAEEDARLVRSAIDQIPAETDRAIIRLRFGEGLSLQEISQRLSLSYDEVRDRFHASIRHLEQELAELA